MGERAILVVERGFGRELPAAPSGSVVASSASLGGKGVAAELHHLGPLEMREHLVDRHRLVANVGAPVRYEWRDGRTWRSHVLAPGDFCLQSHGDANEPEDIADTIVFLAAEESKFITGAVVDVAAGGNARYTA